MGLKRLDATAKISQQSAYPTGTSENLNRQWVKYLEFCIYFSLVALLASTTMLVWYGQYLSNKLRSHSSLVSYMVRVKTLHNLLNYHTKRFHGLVLRLTIQGTRHKNKHITHRACLIMPKILQKIHGVLDFSNDDHVVFWTASLVAFF